MGSYAGTMNAERAYGESVQGSVYVDSAAASGDRTYATLLNLVPLIVLTGPGWLVALIVGVVMWRVKAGESAFVDDHGREVVNFLISLALWTIGLGALSVLVLVLTFGVAAVLVLPLALAFGVAGLVVILWGSIRGAMYANSGKYHRFPATFRILK